jgi:hypothetical protein
MFVASASYTFFFKLSLLSMIVLTFTCKTVARLLEQWRNYRDTPEDIYEIVYEEPDFSSGVEGVDYSLWFWKGRDEEVETEE